MPDLLSLTTVRSVLAVVPVADLARAVAWYARLVGRRPDLEPVDGVAEWFLTDTATIQLVHAPTSAGHGVVRVEVHDLDAVAAALDAVGLAAVGTGTIDGVVRFHDLADPDGNEVSLVQRRFSGPPGEPPPRRKLDR